MLQFTISLPGHFFSFWPGHFHSGLGIFILAWAFSFWPGHFHSGLHRLCPSVSNFLTLICMGKKFSKNFIQDSFVSSNFTHIIFSQKFCLAPDLVLHHDPDLGLELLEVPPTACDLPGYQKWPYKPAWAFSFWPGPRPAPGYSRNAGSTKYCP